MKNILGFTDSEQTSQEIQPCGQTLPAEAKEPFRCLVRIRFPGIAKEYSYYNDEFYLEPGDRVFVSGKLYGTAGIVTAVNRHFRINLKDYQKVIAKISADIKGRFTQISDKMVSFDSNVTAEFFEKAVIPPPAPDAPQEEIVYGEGWSVILSDFENSPDIDEQTARDALEYCVDGNVLFISLTDGKGAAYVQGSDLYKVEFSFDGDTVSDLFCSCRYPDPCICRHETAVLVTLRMLYAMPEFENKKNFAAFDKNFFIEEFFAGGEIVF